MWVITISYKEKKDFNADLDNYLSQRRGESNSFFPKVNNFFSKNESSKVPSINETSSTVYEDNSGRKGRFLFIFNRRSKTADKMDEEIEVHEKEFSQVEKQELESLSEEVREIDNEETLLDVEKQSAIARFFSMFFHKKNKSIDDFEEISEDQVNAAVQEDTLKDETRIVLKALHKWISRLPPEQIEAFRRSPDFEMYKDLLEKYGLVR